MTAQSELHTLAVKVGEISGQLREVIHTVNNMAQKVDGMTERLLTAPTAADLEKLSKRVDALEADKDRNDGAKGVFAGVMKSPAAAWIAAIIGVLYGTIKGGLIR